MMTRFGVLVFQAMPYADVRADVQFAEGIGLDHAWVADQAVPDRLPVLEAWTTLAALAAGTSRIRLGTLITNAAVRNAMVLARQALTVDQISQGRLEVGIGAGYYAADHRWLGVEYLDARGRVERLKEVAEVLDRAMRGERVTYQGRHVHLDDAPFFQPVQRPRPPIWIAAAGPTSMALAARLAEGVALVGHEGHGLDQTLAAFAESMKRIDSACADQPRDPASLRRCYLGGFAEEPIFSSVESTIDFIGRFSELGATDFAFALAGPASPFAAYAANSQVATREQLERLVADVIPSFRQTA